jgi:hypothetical protein
MSKPGGASFKKGGRKNIVENFERLLDLKPQRGGAKLNVFETADFYLACFLRCVGYDLLDVKRDGRKSVFVFQDRPERRATTIAFYNDEGEVRPLSFVGAIKNMKALIHNV